MRNRPIGAAIYGVDLGKNRFDVVACDAMGKPVQRLKLTRHGLLPFFGQVGKALIGMEACPGAQWLARKLSEMGHSVRIIPAQFVKPFVKSNKNDARDAEAIVEALIRPTMRFVESQIHRPARSAGTPSHSRPDCRKSDAAHLPDPCLLPRVWRGDPARYWDVQDRNRKHHRG
jgi:hypothetical protein